MNRSIPTLAYMLLAAALAGCSGAAQSAAPFVPAAQLGAPTAPVAPAATAHALQADTSAPPAQTDAAATQATSATNKPALGPTDSGTYTDANGGFAYVYYVPSHRKRSYPVVLALHGCLESPANFEAGTRWFEDAEAHGYVVVMPQHLPTNVPVNPKGCWQYWSDHYRDRGEPAVLIGLLNDLGHRIPFDRHRMYVTGMSSGGAMTTALAADYPDVFAAAAVGSGTEYQPCQTDSVGQCYVALTTQAADQDPTASGKAAFHASAPTAASNTVPTTLFQGDADTVVAPFNLPQALTSIAVMNDGIASSGAFPGTWTATPTAHDSGAVPGGYAYDHYSADNGRLDWTIVHGMNHAWSGGVADANSNASDGNNYNDPKGPNETATFRAFLFRHHR